jgi:hypothetical protein
MDSRRIQVTVSLVMALALAGLGASGALRAQPATGPAEGRDGRDKDDTKTALTMRVSPSIAFTPARVSARAELRGEPPPEQEALLYCASIEWDWGDGTRSESQYDCEPYEAGKSTLRRRFTAEHTYNFAGRYRVLLRLKRENRTVLAANSTVQVRSGVRDWGP